jgi:hypothetical protein
MANKTNRSPLNQFGAAGRLGGRQTQPQASNMFAGGLSGAMSNTANQIAAQAQQAPRPISGLSAPAAPVVKNQMMQSPINPKAVGNARMVRNVYGNQNPGTFTRSVQPNGSPIMQMDDQTMQMANPAVQQDMPQMPPEGVQTSITPTLGFEND